MMLKMASTIPNSTIVGLYTEYAFIEASFSKVQPVGDKCRA